MLVLVFFGLFLIFYLGLGFAIIGAGILRLTTESRRPPRLSATMEIKNSPVEVTLHPFPRLPEA